MSQNPRKISERIISALSQFP